MLAAFTLPVYVSQYVAIILAAALSFVVIIVIQRIYFHPYSKVPGPFFAKVTSIYSAWHSWRGTMHLDVQRCHRKYAIYGHGAPFRKAKGYATMIPTANGWSTMPSIDKTLHRNLRAVVRSGLGADFLSRFEPAILRHLKIYFCQLRQHQDRDGWTRAADMRKWNLYLGFDTMADFGLGLKTDLLRSSARDYIFPALHMHEKKMGLWEQLPALSNMGIGQLVGAVLPLLSSQARAFARWYRGFMELAIATNTHESHGIFGPVIQSGQGTLKSKSAGHNREQMVTEGAFSTFSSADAYGIMLSGFLHYLCHCPAVYETLAADVRARYRPGEDIRWDAELASSAYLRAVINEVLRLVPPACGVHWRECERAGFTVGPGSVPMEAGSDVGMSLFALFRDGRVFRDPTRFWPERWIPGTLPEAELCLARAVFAPFLLGPRNCAGSHVALMMASVAYAYVLVNYDFCLGQPQAAAGSAGSAGSAGEGASAGPELSFESHYSIASWESGPFVRFRARQVGT
ncbi:benzoate 4-monooxygenase cytochrome P450 [Metarhizium album ARSEF 1941]|uniref:Benzoate 4-monooxygenase cytochrome P450 n=1 Tax=Metarhizium album (strain ARSEF 1941) TaxID=1081103 RepID=A0A0B2X6F6_METAS|nr:benzoate 4-monooxygenase cytochrome P450 [Metarhizium album ARSEF 1941]KHO01974.1 benzoate 4-monooxygenase cytochrome P450 [Metarhizium album ARSEF 1941]